MVMSCAQVAVVSATKAPTVRPANLRCFIRLSLQQAPEQIPAAPLLIGAYVIVLAGLFTYVFSLSRRLGAVQRDVERLEGDIRRKDRA